MLVPVRVCPARKLPSPEVLPPSSKAHMSPLVYTRRAGSRTEPDGRLFTIMTKDAPAQLPDDDDEVYLKYARTHVERIGHRNPSTGGGLEASLHSRNPGPLPLTNGSVPHPLWTTPGIMMTCRVDI